MSARNLWVVGGLALMLGLAAANWLLSGPAQVDAPPALPAPASVSPQAAVAGAAVEARAGATAPAASAPAQPFLPRTSDPSASDDLRRVLLALEDDATPAQARRAADMLARCEHADRSVEFAYQVRDQGGPLRKTLENGSGSMDPWIKESQDMQRRCQIFDAATLARRGDLLKRAYDGALPGMALEYLIWLNARPGQAGAPELLGKLQREVQQTAEEGDVDALMAYVHSFGALGETAMQRQAYKEAWLRILAETSGSAATQESRDSMENLEKVMRQGRWAPPALSAAERREVDALTERVVEAWRQRHR